jgi:hypothetical protein
MNSEVDKSYTTILDFVEIVDHTNFFIWDHFDAQMIDLIFRSKIWRILLSQQHIFKNS